MKKKKAPHEKDEEDNAAFVRECENLDSLVNSLIYDSAETYTLYTVLTVFMKKCIQLSLQNADEKLRPAALEECKKRFNTTCDWFEREFNLSKYKDMK